MPTDEHKAVVRRYIEEFHTGRADALVEQIVAPSLLCPTREATGRLRAAFPGYHLTPVTWTGTTTLRLMDGKIAEVVGTNWDHLQILQQLGVVTSASPRPGA
jgi:hypothetical protein